MAICITSRGAAGFDSLYVRVASPANARELRFDGAVFRTPPKENAIACWLAKSP